MKAIGRTTVAPLAALAGLDQILANRSPSDLLAAAPPPRNFQRTSLDASAILIDPGEPSFIWFGAQDLADYLKEITGTTIPIRSVANARDHTNIILGQRMARRAVPAAYAPGNRGDDGYRIECKREHGKTQVIVAGWNPQGTNLALARLMQMIRAEGTFAYLEGALPVRRKPSFPLRGIHLNGWPFNSPYSFRDWQENDWQRFIDMVWLQGANLFLLWPFMEIMPVPLSPEDAAYLQEVRRVVEYAQEKRGMEVWIMHAANRIAVSDCGVRDPRKRPYWINQCQVDLNPADPKQFKRIVVSFQVLYSTLNNADGFAMIDSDPGGWPQSPLRDQVKIFNAARSLLDRYNQHGRNARLIDWMWVGWGRHKHFDATHTVVSSYDWGPQNPDASDVAFMEKTIQAFKNALPEPWSLIAGFAPYLGSAQQEGVLAKTVFLPYGAIEYEPSVPATNVSMAPVRNALDALARYPGVAGVMGNVQTPLLQLPRTYYFLTSACDYDDRRRREREVLDELARYLYPQQSALIVDAYLALKETDAKKIKSVIARLQSVLKEGKLGRPGVLGRKLFPNHQEVAQNLDFQLKTHAARQALLQALHANAPQNTCQQLVEDYLEAVLAWNRETGWQRMIKIGIWTQPLYKDDATFRNSLSALKRAIGGGAPVTSYAQIERFFATISQPLLRKYDREVVMETCIDPLKLAVIQAP